MSEIETTARIANQMLAALRRMEQVQAQLMGLASSRQELIGRLERNMREGFARTERGLQALRSDVAMVDDRVRSSLKRLRKQSARLDDHEERLGRLESGANTLDR